LHLQTVQLLYNWCFYSQIRFIMIFISHVRSCCPGTDEITVLLKFHDAEIVATCESKWKWV
jgi:hypothetical protein